MLDIPVAETILVVCSLVNFKVKSYLSIDYLDANSQGPSQGPCEKGVSVRITRLSGFWSKSLGKGIGPGQ